MSRRDDEFREFMRNHASPLHQSAYLLCGDWHLAHDLVQDTLVKAYRHWPRIRQVDSPDAYVRRILLNEVRGRWRRRERVVPVARFPEGASRSYRTRPTRSPARRACCKRCSPCRCGSAPPSSSATSRG